MSFDVSILVYDYNIVHVARTSGKKTLSNRKYSDWKLCFYLHQKIDFTWYYNW